MGIFVNFWVVMFKKNSYKLDEKIDKNCQKKFYKTLDFF
ncbi:hypothetical protein MYAER_2023 [Microcystis aeruginosa NIES-2549]|uniref:Uncharacterized protein n=1 Tax=Microcystis aeruginosa NIES-2549 TaxID=1641812 RepID=A0A0F6U481_MICAE|nr:hypothetical protein MYAER_2023 [Microcystis aeruginosa NIES-2549]